MQFAVEKIVWFGYDAWLIALTLLPTSAAINQMVALGKELNRGKFKVVCTKKRHKMTKGVICPAYG
jgi:hypothetical protein